MDAAEEVLDLDAYLERIGYTGPCAPTLAVLSDLVRLHTLTIPFENLDPLLGRISKPELGHPWMCWRVRSSG